jgi:16S rRNA G966 N2-methylase RsmD
VPVNLADNLSLGLYDAQSLTKATPSAILQLAEAKPHTPIYTMHKYFARRPWNVFSQLVSHYSSPGDIVLDPFCGGGTTVVESLKLGRKAIGVDVNPLATYITRMECESLSLEVFRRGFYEVRESVQPEIQSFYATKCEKCGKESIAHWIEWDERSRQMTCLKYYCSGCGEKEKEPSRRDQSLSSEIDANFAVWVEKSKLWFPRTRIPRGDKTNSLLNHGTNYFFELFTKRNLLALSMLLKAIDSTTNNDARALLKFAFSGTLKWASKQSHRRGQIVEGWALHAYWIYPRSLEINVWEVFERRMLAVLRGKQYLSQNIAAPCRLASSFKDMLDRRASCLMLHRSASRLPIPDNSIDAIITDPPYGGNINYAELSDFWYVWLNRGKTIDRKEEVVINRTQGKALADYERMLHTIFRECYRVLKPNRCLVCTFNSKDMRIVTSFIAAVSRSGFVLPFEGLVYQRPIRAYTTTFHAMQIGAFVGDFIFAFKKKTKAQPSNLNPAHELCKARQNVSSLIREALRGGMTEVGVREKAYQVLIPLVAKYAHSDRSVCEEAVDFFENKMMECEPYFRELRRTITEERRQAFRNQRGYE